MARARRGLSKAAAFVMIVAAPGALASRAMAERSLANDTLAESTPAAVSCGFCVGERYASILPIDDTDLPFDVLDVQIALGAARVAGVAASRCEAIAVEALPRLSAIEIWVGDAEDPGPQPGGPDESLLWSTADYPLVPSVAAEGSAEFEVNFNDIEVEDAERVTEARYLRVVVDIPPPAALVESVCTSNDWGLDPDSFPMRDADGIMEHRNAAFSVGGAGLGWVWSEDLGLTGDWGIRAVIQTRTSGMDAGVPPPPRDAGPREDAAPMGPRDAGRRPTDMGAPVDGAVADAGSPSTGSSGGSCAAAGRGTGARVGWIVLGVAATCVACRRSRARRRSRGR